jgi:hypothetical protein
MNREFTPIIVHNRGVNVAGSGTVAFYQPENPVDYSSGNRDGVRFSLDVLGTTGTADSWALNCKFQMGKWDTTGAGLSGFAWYDLQPEQVSKLILEGVDWYAGVTPPSVLTNLITVPSVEYSGAGWSNDAGTGGTATASRPTDGSIYGLTYRRITWTAATTGTVATGGQNSSSFAVTPGITYNASAYVRMSKNQRGRFYIRWYNGGTLLSTTNATTTTFAPNTWTRGAVTAVAPATATLAYVGWAAVGTVGTDPAAALWAIGDTMDIDAAMAVEGSALYDYFDGDTNGGTWTGAAGASTSTKNLPTSTAANVVARSTDTLPLLSSRAIKGFGRFVRCYIWPTAVNPSADFAVNYSLSAD